MKIRSITDEQNKILIILLMISSWLSSCLDVKRDMSNMEMYVVCIYEKLHESPKVEYRLVRSS